MYSQENNKEVFLNNNSSNFIDLNVFNISDLILLLLTIYIVKINNSLILDHGMEKIHHSNI